MSVFEGARTAAEIVHGNRLVIAMLSILRKARLKDKEMRILMLYVGVLGKSKAVDTDTATADSTTLAKQPLLRRF